LRSGTRLSKLSFSGDNYEFATHTCKLQGVDPYTYLVDVLQRISEHPASRVIELTPREWKTKFADNPMRSDLALATQ